MGSDGWSRSQTQACLGLKLFQECEQMDELDVSYVDRDYTEQLKLLATTISTQKKIRRLKLGITQSQLLDKIYPEGVLQRDLAASIISALSSAYQLEELALSRLNKFRSSKWVYMLSSLSFRHC